MDPMTDEADRLPSWFARLLLVAVGALIMGWVGVVQIAASSAAESISQHETRIQVIERNYATTEDILRSEARVKDCIVRSVRGETCEVPR